MSDYGITVENFYQETIEIGSGYGFSPVRIIKAGEGDLKAGQVLAYASDSLKLVKYAVGAGDSTSVIVAVLLEDVNATGTEDVSSKVLMQGKVHEGALKGISYIGSNVVPANAVVTKISGQGGSLTAGTYGYKVVGVSDSGNTVPSTSVSGTTETVNLILKVVFEKPVTMDTVKIYRDDTDYYEVTAEELAQGFFLDDGNKTWVAGVPVTATDYAAIKSLESSSIYPIASKQGFSFRK